MEDYNKNTRNFYQQNIAQCFEMTVPYDDVNKRQLDENEVEETIIYSIEIDRPELFYTYSLEWDFINLKN